MNRTTRTRLKGLHLALLLALAGLTLVVAPASVAYAASFAVTKTADTADGACDSDCSLREAIIAANAAPGADSIRVPAGTYTLALAGAGEDAAATGDLDILGDLTIRGAGSDQTIVDGGALDRVFDVIAGSVMITRVTIQNGRVHESERGGGIANSGVLKLSKSIVRASFAGNGSGISNDGTLELTGSAIRDNHDAFFTAGGLYNAGTATLRNSAIQGNASSEDGGGLFNTGTATLINSTVRGNLAVDGAGGGILNRNTLVLRGSVVRDNTAQGLDDGGGGIANWGTLTATNSLIRGNRTNEFGGGLFNGGMADLKDVAITNNLADQEDNQSGDGGGIYNTGRLTLRGSRVGDNSTTAVGGGIGNAGALTLDRSAISGNIARSGGGLYNTGTATLTNSTFRENRTTYYSGGGIDNRGTLSMIGGTLNGNVATEGGSGLYNADTGTATLTNSIVRGNSVSDGSGGGIDNRGTLTLDRSTVRGNTATFGGGIQNVGALTLDRSAISDNATNDDEDGGGGGIENVGVLTATNSTISGNRATGDGGGIRNLGFDATADLNNVTIAKNIADSDGDGHGDGGGIINSFGTVTLRNTVIGNNADTGGEAPDCTGTLTSEGYNLVWNPSGCTIVGDTTGNLLGQNPRLDTLSDNGGPTQTHALQSGSPAIDAGNPAAPGSGGACAATDQRGVVRPQGAACDIGAYER